MLRLKDIRKSLLFKKVSFTIIFIPMQEIISSLVYNVKTVRFRSPVRMRLGE